MIAKIYWLIAIPATAIFLIQLGITIFGPKPEPTNLNDTSKKGIEEKPDITFQPVNFRNIIGFFSGFSWSGLACIDSGLTSRMNFNAT